MTFRLLALAVATGVLAASAAAGACGGDGAAERGVSTRSITAEEYFQEVARLNSELETRLSAVDAELAGLEQLDAVRDVFPHYLDPLDEFVGDFRRLDPPAEAELAHQAAVDAARAFRDEFELAVAVVNRAQTFEEVVGVTDTDAFAAADARLTSACLALQAIAAASAIDVDLGCGRE